jgi:hypothetical protein
MILGMDTYTFVHVALSLIGIAAGIIVLFGWLADVRLPGWTALFLSTMVLTSVTGFGFPFSTLLPSHIVGIISLIVLAVALYALYGAHLSGAWRWIYLVTATIALYLNVFVLIVQAFIKIPALNALAPTQADAPFVATQGAVLVVFVVLGLLASRRFRS